MEAQLRDWVGERLSNGNLDVPVLPTVAHEAMRAAADPSVDARRLAEIAERDQTIAAHLLRVANSPMYAPNGSIVSIKQAMLRLGARIVGEIAMIVAVKAPVLRAPGWESEIRDIFGHAIATALFAKEVARAKRWSVEEAFLAGLVHDLGRPILIQALLDGARGFGQNAPRALISMLVEELHAEVGCEVARRWSLPQPIVDAIARHHDPNATAPMTLVVQLADTLAGHAMGGELPDRPDSAIEKLHLYPEQVETLVGFSESILASVRAAS